MEPSEISYQNNHKDIDYLLPVPWQKQLCVLLQLWEGCGDQVTTARLIEVVEHLRGGIIHKGDRLDEEKNLYEGVMDNPISIGRHLAMIGLNLDSLCKYL